MLFIPSHWSFGRFVFIVLFFICKTTLKRRRRINNYIYVYKLIYFYRKAKTRPNTRRIKYCLYFERLVEFKFLLDENSVLVVL